MTFATRNRPRKRLKAFLAGTLLLIPLSGCAVDTDQLTTDVVQAALQSISTSLVESLGTYLAGQ